MCINFSDINGLILYNSENQGREGDYIALQLNDGVPEFIMDPGTEPVIVKGDRPLQLNTWHTIRLSRAKSKGNSTKSYFRDPCLA